MVALVGAAGSLSEPLWAQMHSFGNHVELVADNALTPSVGGGTRQAVTGSGQVACCRCYADLPAATVSLAANGGGSTRRDYRVAEFNWGSSASPLGTLPDSVEVKTVQGGGGGAVPALTQNPGSLWQVPLGLYQVPSGGGAVTVEDVRPRRRRIKPYRLNVPDDSMLGTGSEKRLGELLTIPDPGWPYLVQMMGQANFGVTTVGYGRVFGYLDDVLVTSGFAGAKNESAAVLRTEVTTTVRTGSVVAKFTMGPVAMSSPLVVQASQSGFTVLVLPA